MNEGRNTCQRCWSRADAVFRVNTFMGDPVLWCRACLKKSDPVLFANVDEMGITEIVSLISKSDKYNIATSKIVF